MRIGTGVMTFVHHAAWHPYGGPADLIISGDF
jgi:hypothetical protein